MSQISKDTPSRDDLFDMYVTQNISKQVIEQKYGVARSTLNRWFKYYDLPFITRRDRNRPSRQLLIDMNHNKQMTIQSISKHFNKAQIYIMEWFKYYGIEVIRYRKKRKFSIGSPALISMHHDNKMSLKDISEYLQVSDVIVGKWFDEFKIEKRLYNNSSPTSKAEQQIFDFVTSLGFAPTKTRSVLPARLELDIYVKDKKFAVEHCGLYWHNEERLSNSYHVVKNVFAREKDIFLFTLFEDEWIEKRAIVESMIRNKLGRSKRLFARKCTCAFIDAKQAKEFLKNTHLQGAPNRIIQAVGLFNNQQLVGCITFGVHPRHGHSTDLILQRLSFDLNTTVVGGASKMFSFATSNLASINNIITWSDNRYATGDVYKHLGFQKDQILPADYYYIKGQRRYPKQRFQKRFTGCPKNVTERDFMLQQGYKRIWDCGKTRWSKTFNKTELAQT